MGETTTTCTCGRPKWTEPDLKRWEDEAREAPIPKKFNPEWAKAICWYVGADKCPMKPVAPVRAQIKRALTGLVERYASHLAAAEAAFEAHGRSTQGEEDRIKKARAEMDAAIAAVADEIEALDAWRDAKCAAIRIWAPETDAGEYGCSVDYHGGGEHDGEHHPQCPVAVARVAFFSATDRRRAL